jgi:hypothetical protein
MQATQDPKHYHLMIDGTTADRHTSVELILRAQARLLTSAPPSQHAGAVVGDEGAEGGERPPHGVLALGALRWAARAGGIHDK